jgi:hypothetical protein
LFYRTYSRILLGLYGLWYGVLSLVLTLPWIINGLHDDSFYYLQVARNIVRGMGSSFDGQEMTNGYHPLWMLILVVVQFLARAHLEAAVRAGLVICSLLGLGSLLWVRKILRDHAGWGAALCGMLLFAWPRIFGQTINLLETGLLTFFYLCFAALLVFGKTPGRQRILAGLLLGLICLTRLDSVFLLLSVFFFVLYRTLRDGRFWGRSETGRSGTGRSAGGRATLADLLPLALAGLMVLPYLLWNYLHFGHLQPISGAVKSTFPHPVPHWNYLWQFPDFLCLLLLGAGAFLASLRRRSSPLTEALGVFGLAALFHMAYTVLFMNWGVDRWHFGLLLPVGLLGLPWLLMQIWRTFARPLPSARRQLVPRVVLVLGLAAAVSVQALSMRARAGRHLAAMREAGLWAHDNLPADAVYGMGDAGIFAYFSERTTINLDGLINNFHYQEELKAGRVLQYLAQRKIGYYLESSAYGDPALLSGNYESRSVRFWYRPENRIVGAITLYKSDEIHRVNLLSRRASMLPPEPNAIIFYRYRPEKQGGG